MPGRHTDDPRALEGQSALPHLLIFSFCIQILRNTSSDYYIFMAPVNKVLDISRKMTIVTQKKKKVAR